MSNRCINNWLIYFLFLLNKQKILLHHVRCIYCIHRQFRHIILRYFSYQNHAEKIFRIMLEFIHIRIISDSYENYVLQNALCMWQASRNIDRSIDKWRFLSIWPFSLDDIIYSNWLDITYSKWLDIAYSKLLDINYSKWMNDYDFRFKKSYKWYHLLLNYCRYSV